MEYTEEEKQAIKECESLIKKEYYGDMYFYERRSIQIVLNLLEKQQKELELTIENYKNQIEGTVEIAKILNLPEDATIEEIYAEVKKIKQFKVYISDMRSGKELLNKYINDSIPKEVIRNKIKELENQKISIKVGFEKIFETKIDNAKIIDTLRELLRGE